MATCSPPEGYLPWPNNIDCDDSNPAIPLVWYNDSDGDGYGAFGGGLSCDSIPGFVRNNLDCDPYNPVIHPNAQEICNNMDDDCDGLVDGDDEASAAPLLWYFDIDDDGFGDPNNIVFLCNQENCVVGTGTDCNDANAAIYPGPPEVIDGEDNDCDGLIDEAVNDMNIEAGDCEVVFYGYDTEACQTLTATVSGGTSPYTYAWSNGETTATISVCPTATTTYSVTITDDTGDTATDDVMVEVVDVHCGNNNDKVLVCHIPPR